MTKQDLWLILGGKEDAGLSLLDELKRTSFDELLEINLRSGQFTMIYHVDDKYAGAVSEGDFERLYSYAAEYFVHPDDSEAYRKMINPKDLPERLKKAPVPGVLTGEFRLKGVDSGWIWTRQILIAGPELGLPEWIVQCYVYDVQRQRARAGGAEEAGNAREIRYEEVTGLPEGMDYFRSVQKRLPELSGVWCMVDIVIEHYKLFCDWYGLESSRYLLSRIGGVLRETAQELGGMPGYLGQEEFCLVAPYDRAKINDLHAKLQKLITSVSLIDGFSPVFGIAMLDDPNRQILAFYNDAALTAETLREDTSERIRVYDAALHKKNAHEYEVLCRFQNAIENGEISFCLQPQVHASNGKIVGAESLARWQLSDGTSYSPTEFVPILEKYGIITLLDKYIWKSVCRWAQGMIRRGKQIVPISVNVSQLDIEELDVPEYFLSLVRQYGLKVDQIKIEITESACANDSGSVRAAVTSLREMGFTVIMDDFGSGYSSLNMLRSLSVDLIKLDAQFLRIGEEERKKGISILESIVNLTKTLSTPIIVEGVEREDQVRFLKELGCRYVQGFYFYHPMPPAQFEELLSDASMIDPHGFVFKANQQLRTREFLDANIYSDAMLNNVMGPVVFYNWKGENVDIVRFNEQFYELVGIEIDEFERRKIHIQQFLPESDRQRLYDLLSEAETHWALGSRGMIRAFRPNGALVWLDLKLYFLGEDDQGKKFYASAQDVTELQVINAEMPGAYYRCTVDDGFFFLYLSRNFLRLTGYSEAEIKVLFDNRLIRMIHPDDAEKVLEESKAVAEGRQETIMPYRIRRKGGEYIYVAEQSQISDRFGTLCWQTIVIDVSEVMHLRNQMRVLSNYMTSTILFLRNTEEGLVYEVAIHGLADVLGMDAESFQQSLNSGQFCTLIEGYDPNIPHQAYTRRFASEIDGKFKPLSVHMPDGRKLRLVAHADRVDDRETAVEYIIGLRLAD